MLLRKFRRGDQLCYLGVHSTGGVLCPKCLGRRFSWQAESQDAAPNESQSNWHNPSVAFASTVKRSLTEARVSKDGAALQWLNPYHV